MHLPRTRLSRPGSLQEALALLKTHGSSAKILAGGTELVPRFKYRLVMPETLISLKRVPIASPSIAADAHLSVNALTTLGQVVESELIIERTPLLAEAAESVGSNQIRNMATLGGNLCIDTRCWYYNQSHTFQFMEPCFKRGGECCYVVPKGKKCWALFVPDTAVALIGLNASVQVTSADDRRRLLVEDLYTGESARPLGLSAAEMVEEVIIPAPSGSVGSAFEKFTLRGGLDFAILSVAAVLETAEDGLTCASARIAIGGISAGPVRAKNAEAALTGQPLANDLFHEVAKIVASEVKPWPRPDFGADYLRKCLETKTLDALARAKDRVRPPQGNQQNL